jgi:hypothetical protein
MTPEARETGLGGQIDGVLQKYRIVPGTPPPSFQINE